MADQYVLFTVNGKHCKVTPELPRETSLYSYLRYQCGLTGTKAMCLEGGCGLCIVAVRAKNPTTGQMELFSINSCLVLVISCGGWAITTVEGTGNRLEGYNDIQKRIAEFAGTQCGFCTPGFVMQMYSLSDKKLSMKELERSFGSNTCRCTGYRPILDTMKSFAVDASPDLLAKCADIEDLKRCTKTNKLCAKTCSSDKSDWSLLSKDIECLSVKSANPIVFTYGKTMYTKVFDEGQIYGFLDKYGYDSYMLVDGNTGKGIYENFEYPRLLIDIREVHSLKQYHVDQNLVLGANISLEDAKTIFDDLSQSNAEEFSYLEQFAQHLDLVAHIPVRKIGSLAGNLMIKHQTPSFPSDVFLLLSAVEATVTVRKSKGQIRTLFMPEFLNFDMTGYLIVNIELPPLSSHHILKSYKIMSRHQNDIAIVNAAFLINLDVSTKELKQINITYGNITSDFIYACKTEDYLKGKHVFDDNTIQGAIRLLDEEIQPSLSPALPCPESRKKLAIGLFFKFMLNLAANFKYALFPKYESGAFLIERPISNGKQDFQMDRSKYPITESVTKLEAYIQASGEAEYTNDVPNYADQVFGAFVMSTVHSGTIDRVDTSDALEIEGVIAVFTAKDIPGQNSFTVPGLPLETELEEVLSSGPIKFYGQPIAIVVASNQSLAVKAAEKVKVTYKDVGADPVLTIKDAKLHPERLIPIDINLKPKSKGTDVYKVIKGVISLPTHHHYYTEPLATVVVPKDNGLEVYDTTQWMELTQHAIALMLRMNMSDVQLKIRRVGGAFGGKISRNVQVACSAALVARLLDVPCRFVLPLKTNLTIAGRRSPCETEYEVGVNKNGKIQYMKANIIEDAGFTNNENVLSYLIDGFKHCYNSDTWDVELASVLTDTPGSTYMRGPGTFEGINSIEEIMEHIAHAVNKDPTDVRLANMRTEDNDLPQIVETVKKETQFDKREKEIKLFNEANRWMKKSIQLSVMLFPVLYYRNFTSMVSVYRDGTVSVTTGGIEIGQGANTKVAQVCASSLNIPLEMVSVIPHFTFVSSNNIFTGSSIVSESVCFAAIKACGILNSRLEPIRAKLTNPTWQEVIKQAADDQVDLVAEYMMTDTEPELKGYSAYAVTVLEVQLDVILGKFEILRVDILEDVGMSTNPKIDVGQVEGGYVQGLGYFTSEKIILDPVTGKLLSNRSLTYHVPLALDIPVDFRIKFRYNSNNPNGVLGSKTVGEMGICSAHGIIHALRQCINFSRKDSGYDSSEFLEIEPPYDTATILKHLSVNYAEFTFTGKNKITKAGKNKTIQF